MTRIARLLSVLAIGLLVPCGAQSQTAEPGQIPGRLPTRFQPLEKSNLWNLVSVFGNDQWVDGESIGDIAVSKNGKWGLSASQENAVRLWDLETGDCVRILAKFAWHEMGVAFLQDDKHIVAVKFPELEIIEIETGALKSKITDKGGIKNVAVLPGGTRIVYFTVNGQAYIKDLEKNKLIKLDLEKRENKVLKSISFSEDGNTLALVFYPFKPDGRKVDVFASDSGKKIASLEFPGYVASFALFKDGKKSLVGLGNGSVGVYDTQTGKMIHSFPTKLKTIHTIGLTNDEKRVFAGFDGFTRALFRLEDGKEIWKETGPAVTGCVMTPDGKSVFTRSASNSVMLWDLENGKPRSHKQRELGTARPIGFLGDLIVTRGVDNPVQVNFWKPDGTRVKNFGLAPGWDTSDPYLEGYARITSSGRVFVYKNYQSNGVLNLETNQITPLKNAERVRKEVFSKDLKWLYGSSNGTLKKWDVETGEEAPLPDVFKNLEKENGGQSNPIRYHFDAKKAARYNGLLNTFGSTDPIGRMEFHDLATGKMVAVDSNDGLVPIAFSDDGDLVLVNRNLKRGQELSLWDTETGQNIRNFKGFDAPLIGAVFSPSRKYLLALSKDTILKVFNPATGELVDQIDFEKINDFPSTICMSKDFKKMLIGTKRGLSLYFESK